MKEFLSSVNTRDIATAIWLGIFVTWCVTKPKVRQAFCKVVAAATAWRIAVTFSLAIAHLSAVTFVLTTLGLWTIAQLKITGLWFAGVGIPILMSIPQVSRDVRQLRSSFGKNFKLSLLLDFFVNLYKMPLLAELIFVPFSALVGGLLAVAQSDDKYSPVQKLLNGVLSVTGVGIIGFVTYKITTDFAQIANLNTLRNFALPLIYSLAYFPLTWAFVIYAAYESVFCLLPFVIKDPELHPYVRRRLIFSFGADVSSLNTWLKAASSTRFITRSDVVRSIEAITTRGNAA